MGPSGTQVPPLATKEEGIKEVDNQLPWLDEACPRSPELIVVPALEKLEENEMGTPKLRASAPAAGGHQEAGDHILYGAAGTHTLLKNLGVIWVKTGLFNQSRQSIIS